MTQKTVTIKPNDLSHPEVLKLLDEHLQQMASQSPPESVHALDASALKDPSIKFWAAWTSSDQLGGIAALKFIDLTSAEIKSMRTHHSYRRCGVAAQLLHHLIAEAQSSGITTLYLETGSMHEFLAARTLYRKFGFTNCAPYADYIEDPNSAFMKLELQATT